MLKIPDTAPQVSVSAPATVRRHAPVPALRPRIGPRISRLVLADAPASFTQTDVLDLLEMHGDEFAERIFARCGVRTRRLYLTEADLAKTLQERTPAIEDQLFGHAIAAVEGLELDPRAIGTLLTSTLYSLGGPTLAHRLVEHFRMRPDTDKYHVAGVGCASAVPLMRLLGQCLQGHPGQPAVVVAAESMSGILASACPDDPRAKVVGSAIFGDGCAAAVLSDEPSAEGPAIVASTHCQIPGTLDAVSLELSGADIYLRLSRDLPDLAAAGLDQLVARFLHEHGIERREIDHWMVHPGGRRIIDSVQDALSLSDEDVGTSRDVLARSGNIGTPAIFYVMHETIEQRGPSSGDRGLVVTIGPGITVGLMLLQW
jgi:alkylresorcinol/alkylpyrone synthase